jgi:preprotein translocase subunit YajC
MKRKMSAVLIALASLSVSPLWAMASRPADPNAAPPPAWVSFMPMLVMVGVFYFLLIRPQMKQRSERQKMLDAVKKGDKIVTQGGLIATVVSISPTVMEIKLNEETKVKILRSAVSEIYTEPVVEPQIVNPS